uniref:G-protein coupled receptors family 1 profile domain-containing protein n=1 Tax=Acrobeloides nanus TaxID=290746 RepID=A0A914DNI5_9BILA
MSALDHWKPVKEGGTIFYSNGRNFTVDEQLYIGRQACSAWQVGIVFSQVFHIFSTRSLRQSMFTHGPFRNKSSIIAVLCELVLLGIFVYVPYINEFLGGAPVPAACWGIVAAVSIFIFCYNELRKFCIRKWPQNRIQRIQTELNRVYDVYYGWLALPLASIALVITIIFIISIFRAIRLHRVSRKSYVLLLNRSIGDLLACTVAISNGIYILLEDEVNRDIVQLVDTFYTASYWSAMVSYVSLSLLKLYAVARPFKYRKNMNMKRCIHLIYIR